MKSTVINVAGLLAFVASLVAIWICLIALGAYVWQWVAG